VEDVEFSDAFCRFVQAAVPALDAAELLIWLAQRSTEACKLEEILEALRPTSNLSEAAALRHLESFRSLGLVSVEDDRYRFACETELAAHVETLQQAYRERPVTLIRVIYALRDSKIQTFADAFRFRRRN
jgi:DNA-binding transcriptional ArsR family regulator